MPKSRHFHAFKASLPDASGKVFAITGTTSGTGFVAARTVAECGGEVLLLNRASPRVPEMLEKLQAAVPDGRFFPIECDLQSFASVRRAAKAIVDHTATLNGLAHNAGVMGLPDEATEDGYDIQIQTNHLSPFLLTAILMPLLESAAEAQGDARIVSHSSFGRLHTENSGLEAHYFGPNGGKLGGNEIGFMKGGCYYRYFQSKLANSVFTYGLAGKLNAQGSKVRALCAHPGSADTELLNRMDLNFFMRTLAKLMTLTMQSAEDGAMGLLTGMLMPDAQSGVLYGPEDNGTRGKAVPVPPQPYETDPAAIEMLWRTSEAATQCRLLT